MHEDIRPSTGPTVYSAQTTCLESGEAAADGDRQLVSLNDCGRGGGSGQRWKYIVSLLYLRIKQVMNFSFLSLLNTQTTTAS